MRAPLSTPRLRLPQFPNWSRSGGPAAGRTNAGRVTIATVLAIRTVPKVALKLARKKARSRSPRKAKRARAPSANVMDAQMNAQGASATRISETPAAMRRPRPQALPLPSKARPRSRASRTRTKVVRRASVSKARIEANPATAGTRANSPASRKAIAKAAVRVAARRTGNMRPARRHANASARSIPIRLSPNWRRSRSSSRRGARSDRDLRSLRGSALVRASRRMEGSTWPSFETRRRRRSPSGSEVSWSVAWSASVSTNGCGMPGS